MSNLEQELNSALKEFEAATQKYKDFFYRCRDDFDRRSSPPPADPTVTVTGSEPKKAATFDINDFKITLESHGRIGYLRTEREGKPVCITLSFEEPKNKEEFDKYLQNVDTQKKIENMIQDYLHFSEVKKDVEITSTAKGTEIRYQTEGRGEGGAKTKTLNISDLRTPEAVGTTPPRGQAILAKMENYSIKLKVAEEKLKEDPSDESIKDTIKHLKAKMAKMDTVYRKYGLKPRLPPKPSRTKPERLGE